MSTVRQANPWLITLRSAPEARVRMLCFAYAGGGSAAFGDWAELLPPGLELSAVRLPGRESRLLQRPYAELLELLPDLGEAIAAYCEEPFVLFGHSMGALIAFEYSRWLRDTGRRLPEHLFVSGRRAPQLVHNRPLIHELADDEFIDQLRRFGGTPEELLSDARAMRMVMPGLRADFRLNDTYQYTPASPLTCPMTAFGGVADPHVDQAGIAAWAEQTTGPFSSQMLKGGHFFLHSSRDSLLRELGRILRGGTDSPVT